MVFYDLILACILYQELSGPFAAFKGVQRVCTYEQEIPWLFSLALRLFVNLGMTRYFELRLC